MIIELRDSLDNVYKKIIWSNPKYDDIVNCARNTRRMFVIHVVAYFYNSDVNGLLFQAIACLLLENVHTCMFYDLPFVDSSTFGGFLFTTTFQYITVVHLVAAFSFFDGIYASLTYGLSVFSEYIEYQVDQINGILDMEPRKNSLRIKSAFKNVAETHIDMNE